MNTLEMLRKRCDELMESDPKKYKLIKSILDNDECFFDMDIDTSYNILSDLNFDQEQIKKIYLNVIKKGMDK